MPLRVSIVALLAACGAVAGDSPDAQVVGDAVETKTSTYIAKVEMTPPVAFGGDPFCMYTMTLRQIEVGIEVSASGELLNATAQNLNVEAAVKCPHEPAPPSLARYMFDGSRPVPGGELLMFRGDPANATEVSLVIELSQVDTAYKGIATWQRLDQGPPLDWSVMATLSLILQP